MILQTQQLRDFLKAANMKQNNIIPILDHIQIKDGYAYKSNLQTHVKYKIDADENMLINERDLRAILNTTADTITIANGYMIGDTKIKMPYADPEHYPKMPEMPDDDGIGLTQDIMDALTIAKSFVSEQDIDGALQLVHMKDNWIAATDRFKLYHEAMQCKLPNVMLFREDIELISKLPDAKLYHDDNKIFVTSYGITYCFNKTEDITPKFEMIMAQYNDTDNPFIINRPDLISFCETVNSINDSRVTVCSLTKDGFSFVDADKPATMPATLPDIHFNFNARIVTQPLKALPFNELICNIVGQAIVIKDGNSTIVLYGVTV